MVHTLEGLDVEVAEGVVALLVVYIQQRGDLGETVGHMLQQTAGALLVARFVEVKLYQHHPLAGGGVAEHDVAKQTVLGAKVEEGHAGGIGVVADGIAYLVVKRVHQPALLDGEYLVESARDVETDGVGLLQRNTGGHFLARQPAAVAAAELELVAVETGVDGTQYVIKRGKLHLADARQLVENLALAGVQEDSRENLARALANLVYTALSIRLTPEDKDSMALSVKLDGSSTHGETTVPVSFDVTFHGDIEQLLNTGIKASTGKLKGDRK